MVTASNTRHSRASDYPTGTKEVLFNGHPISHVTETFEGEDGWLVRYVSDENGRSRIVNEEWVTERLTGHVELRDRTP